MKNTLTTILLLIGLTISAQKVTTLASLPSAGDGMIVTPSGDILIAAGYTNDFITKVTKDGEVSTFIEGLEGPVGLAYDSQGNLYVTNYSGNSISKIDPNMVVTQFASRLDGPSGIFINKNDEMFVSLYGSDLSGTGGKVLKYNLSGSSSAYASGSGLSSVIGITMDESNTAYVTNFDGGVLYSVNSNKIVVEMATIENANINQIAYSNGYVYLPVPNQATIYRVDIQTKKLEVFAGNGSSSVKDGDLLEAGFNRPNSCAFSVTGDTLYVLDNNVRKLRQITLKETTSTDDINNPFALNVEQNFPNPFSSETTIKFDLDKREKVKLAIFDNQGRIVEEILNEFRGSGHHNVLFNSRKLSPGIYFYKLSTEENEVTKKMILQKE